MPTSPLFVRALLALVALATLVAGAFAQSPVGPGDAYAETSELSSQKAGSVLIYNIYSSSAVNPQAENTRINMTNTDPDRTAVVHLFFVDGDSCAPADMFICLTPNQTAGFTASDVDPGVSGYLVAIASDALTGCPVKQNTLIGDEYVKLASGHTASLGAEAIAALTDVPCTASAETATINFDGLSYNRLPRVLAADNIPSQADGNSTLLVINRIGGDLGIGAGFIGPLFGLLYNDAETPFSFSVMISRCHFRLSISSLRILGGGINGAIPSGRSGWLKFWRTSDGALLGAVLNANPGTATAAAAFAGGRNLHKLTLTEAGFYTIPVFPPSC